MNISSQMSILKVAQNVQKWHITVSEEPDPRNAALDTGTNLKLTSIRF